MSVEVIPENVRSAEENWPGIIHFPFVKSVLSGGKMNGPVGEDTGVGKGFAEDRGSVNAGYSMRK